MNKPIITSIIDTDLYKLSMQKVVLHQYPKANVAYQFKCRNENVRLGYLVDEIRNELEQWEEIKLTESEKLFINEKLPFLKGDYVDYLSNFRFNPDWVDIRNGEDGDLLIDIRGLWLDTILFEVPLLSTINELHFRHTTDFASIRGRGIANLKDKINMLKNHPRITISEFGTRRRYSKNWQNLVYQELIRNCPQIIGTSNVKMAMDYGTGCQGTVAHEYFSAHLALVDNIRQAQKRALHVWQQEYDKDLGTALTDTFTTKAFWMDFDKTLTENFSSIRHDSGDPIKFGWEAIEHYKKMGVNPKTKTLVFSDGLNIPKAINIFETFTGLIGVSFGIGTSLSNDLGVTPLNIVIKLVECNGKPVVKLSDEKGKNIGDVRVIEEIKKAYGLYPY